MKAIALAMLLASTVDAGAFIASTDCRFGRGLVERRRGQVETSEKRAWRCGCEMWRPLS
jgi:hypothetical protein